MHQPRADRNVSFIGLSLTNGDPCPDFRSGKGGREIENQGGSRTLLPVYTPVRQTTITVLQPQLQESTCRAVQPLRTAHRLLGLAWLCGARHNLQTTTYLKRYCRDETPCNTRPPTPDKSNGAQTHMHTHTHTHA